MTTGYIAPLSAAYRRMETALFRPFDLGKWFVVGFASWIAGWGWGTGGSFNYRSRFPSGGKGGAGAAFEDAMRSIPRDLGGLWMNPWWRVGLIAAVVLLVALAVLILWITSRGEFVFLDAVLHDRRAIVEPWRAGRAQGNSLFVWRLAVGAIMLAGFAMISGGVFVLASGGRIPRAFDEVRWLVLLIGVALAWVPFVVVGIYVDLLLRHFVTPIMFRDRSTTTEAWRTFLPILRERLGAFALYGLFVLVVHIGLLLALIPVICLTCCLLGCVLALPFIGAVLWLPVSYTFRAFGPEFLAQFGPAYSVWPLPVVAPEASPDTTG